MDIVIMKSELIYDIVDWERMCSALGYTTVTDNEISEYEISDRVALKCGEVMGYYNLKLEMGCISRVPFFHFKNRDSIKWVIV